MNVHDKVAHEISQGSGPMLFCVILYIAELPRKGVNIHQQISCLQLFYIVKTSFACRQLQRFFLVPFIFS